ncbi:nuclear transport factor 2 family protein [Nocardia sp. NPDC056000]|uniref:nuclear transport factor 2 family protein n=1 Tax=Nocardia sp. NPDC056000 TaxID=3345674 RepID=UPI0035E3A22B
MSPSLERIQQVIDRADISDAVVRYATAVDTRDWRSLAALFTDDAYWEYSASGERVDGPAAITDRIRSSIERLDATQHFNTNHVVALSGDEAEHICYYYAQHIRRGLANGATFLAGGMYRDRFRRTAQGWKFTARTLNSSWSEGNPAVIGR